MIVSLQTGPAVTFPLLEFLQLHYGVKDLNYLQEPTPILDGYETRLIPAFPGAAFGSNPGSVGGS